jgi:chromosomal replication initiation ATPase DnaA
MLSTVTLVSSTLDSSIAINNAALQQHKAHKERQDRIRKAALADLIKPLPAFQPPPPLPVNEIVIQPCVPQEQYLSVYDLVMKRVCERYRVRREDVLSNRRLGNIVKARHAIIVMLYRFTKWTNFKIADKLKRDPSTVFYVLQKQEQRPFDFSELEMQIQDSLHLINGTNIKL